MVIFSLRLCRCIYFILFYNFLYKNKEVLYISQLIIERHLYKANYLFPLKFYSSPFYTLLLIFADGIHYR
jgi:hypothetical protein